MRFSVKLFEYATTLANRKAYSNPNEFGADIKAIHEIEKSTWLKFPATYIDFLSVFGRGPKWIADPVGFVLVDFFLEYQKEVREELEEEGKSEILPANSVVFRCVDAAELLFFECGSSDNPIVYEISYGKDGAEVNSTGENLEKNIEIAVRDSVR